MQGISAQNPRCALSMELLDITYITCVLCEKLIICGSANQALGFYHIEVSLVESTQWLNLNNNGVVRVKSDQVSPAELEARLCPYSSSQV